MNRVMTFALACVVALAVVLEPSASARQGTESGFEPLIVGDSLSNWKTISLGAKPGEWRVRAGVLSYEPGDSWLATNATYTDFVLRVEYRATGADSDGGIFLRSPDAGYPSFAGMELEIKGSEPATPSVRSTSALYGAVAPTKLMARPAGEWNTVEVSVIKRHLSAIWNGETVHDINLDDPAFAAAQRGPLSARAAEGHVGFQAHLTGAPVEYRNIRLKIVK